MSVSEFFHMGGYAPYVWGSYGVAALLVAWEVIQVRRRRQATLKGVREEIPDLAEHART
jgi:heme exporter protein D